MDAPEFFRAVTSGDVSELVRLVARTPRLIHEARDGDASALHCAVRVGQHEVARWLIEQGVDLEYVAKAGRTALHDSVELSQTKLTELLIASGAFIDVCTAAILGDIERIEELLDADPSLANDDSTELSPLGWAAFGDQVESARLLLLRGARLDDGELCCAASVGHVAVGRLLVEHGASPNERREGRGTALHAAAALAYGFDGEPFVRMLLEHGADPAIVDHEGRTARDIAERRAAEVEARPELRSCLAPGAFQRAVDLLLEAEERGQLP